MQASTNIGRTLQRRSGPRRLLAVSAALVMALAALLLTLALSSTIEPSNAAAQKKMPYTFFLTHYELLGNPNNPSGVRYHNNGKPFAKAPDGSKVILSGKGAWNQFQGERVAGTSWIVFLLRISDAQGEPSEPGRGYPRCLVSDAPGP